MSLRVVLNISCPAILFAMLAVLNESMNPAGLLYGNSRLAFHLFTALGAVLFGIMLWTPRPSAPPATKLEAFKAEVDELTKVTCNSIKHPGS